MIDVDFQGSAEITSKWVKSEWEKKALKEAVFDTAHEVEDEISKNLQRDVYNGRERPWKLTGRAKNGIENKESDSGFTRKIRSNPQIAGTSFDYNVILENGRGEIRPKNKRVLAAPVSRFNAGSVLPYKSKGLPKLSKNGKFVILGKRIKAFQGIKFFSKAVKVGKSKASQFLSKSYQKYKPK